MKGFGKLHVTAWLLGLAGAALFTGLLIRQGIGQVWDAFATAEWTILGIVVYHLISVFSTPSAGAFSFPKSIARDFFNCFGCAGLENRLAH